jgi:DNA-binding LacI/PurR family transcriptional regulator
MRTPAAAPVMTDVARLAGVSHQTVSRVVNDSPNVSGPTRAKVLAAMEQLGYRRNGLARALARRRSGTLGVITFDTVLYGPVSTLYSVEQAAGGVGLGVSIAVAERVGSAEVVRALSRLQDQSVEGIVALAPQRDAVQALAAELRSMPAVLVGGVLGGGERSGTPVHQGLPAVGIDQYGGGAAATRHLLELGHHTVHHIAGPADWLDAVWRTEGWRDTLTAAGRLAPAPAAGDWSARSGYQGMRALLADHPDLTAVFAGNDQMALGALRALGEAGRRVPGEVSVVGFDDIPESEFFGPPLTTVRQHFTEAGRRAVSMLLDLLEPGGGELVTPAGDEPPGAAGRARAVDVRVERGDGKADAAALVPTELVVRESTATHP